MKKKSGMHRMPSGKMMKNSAMPKPKRKERAMKRKMKAY